MNESFQHPFSGLSFSVGGTVKAPAMLKQNENRASVNFTQINNFFVFGSGQDRAVGLVGHVLVACYPAHIAMA